jgi:hypothetical protein
MKDDLFDLSKLEAMKKHPVSSQLDDVFKTVIKEAKSMVKKELNPSVPDALPSIPTELALSDGEFSLDISSEVPDTKEQPPAIDDFELSLDSGAELAIGEDIPSDEELQNPDFGELSLDENVEDQAVELSMDGNVSDEVIDNLGELSFEDPGSDLDLSTTESSGDEGLSLDELELGSDEEILNLSQPSSEIEEQSANFAEAELSSPDESLQDDGGLDLASFSDIDANQNELSDDAKKKLLEIDEILVMDASKVGISNKLAEDNNLDEPLVSEDLDLGSLNFNGEEQEMAPPKEEKPKKKKREPEVKESSREVREELREISGAYTVEMERLQATLSNLRVDRQELLMKIQKFEEDKMLQSRQMLSLQAELDEKKIEMTIIRKKLNEEISELKDRLKVQDEKRLILEEKNRVLAQELEKSAHKSKIDVKKVQIRERELEQKLELLKADAETQIRYRDQKILELKRKIDAMEFDMESISQQEKRSVESRFELEDKLEKAIKTLRSAINVLEDEPDRVDALKALKKNIDM